MRSGALDVRFVARRAGYALLTLAFILAVNFFLFRIMPGDPIALLARSQRLSPAALDEQRRAFGLDQPLLVQFVVYLRETLTGQLGVSLVSGVDVVDLIVSRLWPTVLLVGVGTLLAAGIGVLIGIRGGWRRGSAFDSSSLYSSLVLYSTPEGWLGMLLLLLFAGWLGWFPAGGFSGAGLALPVLALSLGYVGQYAIVMRSSMIEVKAQPYIALARAKGLADPDVRWRHAVPNAVLPTFTLVVLSVGFILGGAIVIETVFSWPGIGLLTYEAINTLDYPVLQGVFLVSSAAVILAAFIADIAYGMIDPQVRQS